MNMATKQNIFEEKKREYWRANRKRKGEILHAVVEVAGLTRKGVVKRFLRMQRQDPYSSERRGRPQHYTAGVIAAKEVWRIRNEPCGENLHPMINECIIASYNILTFCRMLEYLHVIGHN